MFENESEILLTIWNEIELKHITPNKIKFNTYDELYKYFLKDKYLKVRLTKHFKEQEILKIKKMTKECADDILKKIKNSDDLIEYILIHSKRNKYDISCSTISQMYTWIKKIDNGGFCLIDLLKYYNDVMLFNWCNELQ